MPRFVRAHSLYTSDLFSLWFSLFLSLPVLISCTLHTFSSKVLCYIFILSICCRCRCRLRIILRSIKSVNLLIKICWLVAMTKWNYIIEFRIFSSCSFVAVIRVVFLTATTTTCRSSVLYIFLFIWGISL